MADARLSIQISADVANLVSGMNQGSKSVAVLENQLTSLQKNSIKVPFAATGLDKLKADIADAKNNLGSFSLRPISITADTSQLQSKITEIRSEINSLTANASIGINAGDFEATIESIKGKIASLTDAKLNISADPSRAEAAIKEIVSELNNLRDANVILRADGSQAIKVIDTIEGQLQSLVGNIAVDSSGIQAKAAEIKGAFGKLNFTANVDVNDSVINTSIKSINEKLSLLVDPTIDFKANPLQAENAIREINELLAGLKGANVSLSVSGAEAVEGFISQIQSDLLKVRANIPVTIDSTDVKAKVSDLKAQLETIASSVKIGTDTTQFDAAITEVRNKLTLIDDLSVDLVANKEPIEAAIKDVSNDLSRLKGSVVTINADGNPAVRSINQLENELDGLTVKLKSATNPKDFERLGRSVSLVREQLRNISTTTVTSGFKGLTGSSNQATLALTNLGRVVQDAPFGFLGIANNLNPLLESFQRLKAQSGSTRVALKSLASSLGGVGGVGLALSVVSSLLIVFGDRLFGAGKKAEEAAEKIKSSFDVVNDATDSVQGDIAKVNALLNAFSNTSSLSDQKKIIDELKETNKSYFGELKAGVSTYNDISAAAQGYTQALIQQAIVEGLSEEIKKLSGQLRLAKKEYFELSSRAVKAKDELNKVSSAAGNQVKGMAAVNTSVVNAQTNFEVLNKKLKASENNVTSLAGQFGELSNEINKQVAEGLKIKPLTTVDAKKFKDETDNILARARQFAKEFGESFVVPDLEESFFKGKPVILKVAQKLLDDVSKANLKIKLPVQTEFELLPVSDGISQDVTDNFFKSVKIERGIEIIIDPTVTLTKDLTKLIDEKIDLRGKFSNLGELGAFNDIFENIDTDNIVALQQGIERAKELLSGLKSTADSLKNSLAQSLQGTFEGLFEGLGESLAESGGGVAEKLKAVFSTLLSGIGKALIAYGVTKSIMDKLLGPGGIVIPGGVAIAAGVLAVAAAAALRGSKKFASGGYVSGPGGPKEDKIPALLSNGEFVINAQSTKKFKPLIQMINSGSIPKGFSEKFKLPKFADGGLVSFPKLPFLNNNTINKSIVSNRMEAQVVIVNKRLRGRDQVLQLNRENRSQSRRA